MQGGEPKIWARATMSNFDSTYLHASVKMDSDSSAISIDKREIKQSVQSAQARRQSERLLRQKEREQQLRQQEAPERW